MLKFTKNFVTVGQFALLNAVKRNPHFDAQYVQPNLNDLPSYEVSKDPKEWQYVERLLPLTHIPDPPTEIKEYPSGWKPQTVKPGEYPYFIRRSKSHQIPVYLKVGHRGMKRHTSIKQIHGDIWKLAKELEEYLKTKDRKMIGMKVHEICGEIRIMGDHVSNIQAWLEERNF